MTKPARSSFRTNAIAKVDESLGLVFGWGIVCTEKGEPYFDTQGDHIPESAMVEAVSDFMLKSRIAGEMHARDGDAVVQDGAVVFSFPLTEEIAKAFEIECDRTGWLVAIKPSAEVLEKFRSGDYTGFSIGGERLAETVVES